MFRIILKSKIHRCRVTETNLYYAGSIAIDERLMSSADLLPGEKVEVLNLNTGERIETYAMAATAGSGTICLNGPAARKAYIGDEIIIVSYALVEDKELKTQKPKIINVDERNRINPAPSKGSL